ncbi:MAG: cell division protein SepF [Eubacteriales bacterium]|nr:cell division protein SepF [Eubacteriales bacterium]
MGFMDELKKLTQPYEDEDDFFEGADESFKPTPVQTEPPAQVSAEHAAFENSFASPQQNTAPQQPKKQAQQGRSLFGSRQQAQPPQSVPADDQPESLFGSFGKSKTPKAPGRGAFSGGSKESQVILFAPKTFDEAGEIVGHINASHSVVMTLEGLPMDTARRLLDFISGIAFALQGKITPVSAKTYFVTPKNVDIVGAQSEQPESDGQYF